MFNCNIEIWRNAAHGAGPSMDPVQTRGSWTRGPCFVLFPKTVSIYKMRKKIM